ncbi:uncharacterized protein BO96DRAFT_352446 [Aspergillus niger CBS 101883]|uniref:uncharacterized protein n=1 Tax=Aspergillus lacticoffeatus (strain CBS 101883) TaxID=1450533 RepID=UPI000D7ED225|nr:uncharacterized protein BO96DRAFT_352446 [Aspergillus niger CBS 101883]PYH50469.1 hypothetical protein BO96DRAFT_352446 [Aspergillus niger CBS 101883]
MMKIINYEKYLSRCKISILDKKREVRLNNTTQLFISKCRQFWFYLSAVLISTFCLGIEYIEFLEF